MTGQRMAPVTIGQIYRGAIPFVLIQLAMVALIMAFPGLVSRGHDVPAGIDADVELRRMQSDQNAAERANPVPVTADGNSADEDPMKALQQAVEADRKDSPK